MKPGFVDILLCPDCGNRLKLLTDRVAGDIADGSLRCKNRHSFAVRNHIPRFVSSDSYASSFGFEWTIHKETQLDGAVDSESEDAFRQKTGFSESDLAGKLVLDVGCGMGRFSDVASRWGATVIGVDLTRAVDAAQDNIGMRGNVHLAQADIFRLPFPVETFDFIFSIGVLHHTPNTRSAFDQLPRLLKPGGQIAIWLYSSYKPWYRFADVWRRMTTRLPRRTLYALSHISIPLYFAYRVPVLGAMAAFILPISMHPKPKWRVLDTFDWYSPMYQWKHTYEEAWPWFEAHGLRDIRVVGVPVSIQATRPPSGPMPVSKSRKARATRRN
jgi:SAM-dependent methyltransferase